MNAALSKETLRILGLPRSGASNDAGTLQEATDLRHLIQIVDLLSTNRMPVPGEEVKRAVVEIEELRQIVRNQKSAQVELARALSTLDIAEETHLKQLIAWQAVNWTDASKDARMKRRDDESALKFNIEAARRRVLGAVRNQVAQQVPSPPPAKTETERAIEPSTPRDWLTPVT